jgi:hypothetical protein
VRILLTRHLPISLNQALETTLRARYKDIEDTNESLRSLQKQTWLRWLFFIIGTLGPSIKLMAMEGVPWTKAWGIMYFFAFLVIEAAALIARRSPIPWIYASLPGFRTSAVGVAEKLVGMEVLLFCIGVLAHYAILCWAFVDIWKFPLSGYPKVFSRDQVVAEWVVTISQILTMASFPIALFFNWRKHYSPAYVAKWIPRALFTFVQWLLLYNWYFYGTHPVAVDHPYMWIVVLLFSWSTFLCIPVFIWILESLCGLIPGLGDTLLVAPGEDSLSVDDYAVGALIFFIANILVTVLWYCLRYNPEGTVNLGWTGGFG